MTKPARPTVDAILVETITAHATADWSQIVAAVSAVYDIRNWMSVRGKIQALINDGKVERVDDVHREAYKLVTAEAAPTTRRTVVWVREEGENLPPFWTGGEPYLAESWVEDRKVAKGFDTTALASEAWLEATAGDSGFRRATVRFLPQVES